LFVIGNLVGALASVLDVILQMLILVLFVNALLSWVRPDPNHPIVMFLDRVSDVVCDPLRRLFPLQVSGFDLAPLVAMIALWFIRMFAVETLRDIAVRLG
jgi:YggT family protein